jgi:hypothetical protein
MTQRVGSTVTVLINRFAGSWRHQAILLSDIDRFDYPGMPDD